MIERLVADRSPEEFTEPVSLAVRLVNLVTIVMPFLGLLVAVFLLWGWGLTWVELTLFACMYIVTGIGTTVGYHRLFTHRSFETHPVVQCILGVLGSMALQGPLIWWVALHRRHHQHSDRHGDPHSPHQPGRGVLGVLYGLWYAHVGWIFRSGQVNLAHYVKDLRQSALLRAINLLFPVWVVIGLLLPTVLGWLIQGGWQGALLGLIWGGLVRMFFVQHVTWSVNSVCHLWGTQPYRSGDHSRNNLVVGILSLGEGWHNNHHAFPTSARHGLRWWQLDLSYWVICALALVGLAWQVRLPANKC
jgi:stearoyl-CoA desaturase (delta-9 desaturase)